MAKEKAMNNYHTPVLLKEIIDLLQIKKGKKYIDATLGGAGHGFGILKHGGILLGIDCDQEAIDYTSRKWKIKAGNWKIEEENLVLVHGNFKDIDKIARLNNFEKVSGIIFDLGVSSHQFDTEQRGFSFQKDNPLDMRMDKDLAVKAADLVNVLKEKELYALFSKLGEEHRARSISNAIVRARRVEAIQSTRQLSGVVERAYGFRMGTITSAQKQNINKRVFQALRIAVNDELNNLREALPKAIRLLDKNGRVLVISFHSLEDRIVKQDFIEFKNQGLGEIKTKKPIIPDQEEIERNRRSKSAKLRVFEKY